MPRRTDSLVADKFHKQLPSLLLDWFDRTKRDLPWRNTSDPYSILVSELMLQQTQVATVIPYYLRFLTRFPTIESLAAADESEVLRLWSGLGYYRRARSLHAFARRLLEVHQGVIPRARKSLESLPGIGPYTAGAILSIAFDLREPLVDGNVERVLSRLLRLEVDLASTPGKKLIWDWATLLVPAKRPGDYNQALMELGATTCQPKEPRCLLCPLSSLCRGFLEGVAGSLPIKKRDVRKVRVDEVVLIIRNRNQILLTDSNEEGLYGGMWQFPWSWAKPDDPSLDSALTRLLSRYGLNEKVPPIKVHTLSHGVTFRSIKTSFHQVMLKPSTANLRGIKSRENVRWVDIGAVTHEALPSYQRKVLPHLT